MLRKIFIIVSFCSIISSTLHGQFKGGSGAGFGFGNLSSNSCTYDLNPSLLIFAGGKGGGTSILKTTTSPCTYDINPSLLIFAGGKGGGASNLISITQSCSFTIDESLLIFKGGIGGGTSAHASYKMACPEPLSDNIFLGGSSSSATAGALNSNTVAYTNGPFIASILDTSIVNGNCLQLSITGTGANTYSWSPSTGLSDSEISNPIAKPTTTTTYTVTATGTATGCRNKASVTITVLGTGVNTLISYPSKICNNVTTLQSPNLTGITGGQFSSNSTNLKIDANSGQINPSTSSVGVYTVTYTYGTCNNQVSTSVEITNDCASNNGVIEFTNFYTGGAASILAPSNVLLQAACTPNLDYTQLIYTGGAASILAPSNLLVQAACTPNLDYTQLIYKGGQASVQTPSNLLIQAACTPNLDYTQLIYKGGQAALLMASTSNIQLACPIPVGDNFYLGGAGVGYGNGSLTPTTNAVTGTAVAVSSDVTVCPGVATTLSATGASNYIWSPSIGLSDSSISNPIASPSTTTTYTVLGTGAGVGCINTAKVTVIVQNDPSTTVSYGGFNFDEEDLNLKKVKYINGPLSGTFSSSPTGLSFNNIDGSFTPGLSTSRTYEINYAYTKGACNYIATTTINITKLPPTITYTNGARFYINYNGVTLTPNITGGSAEIFELMDSLPTGLVFNTLSGVISGTPTQLIDNSVVRIRAANYKRDQSINWGETFSLTLSVKQPVINLGASSIESLNTTYGTPSTTRNIAVQADNIIDYILVIAPPGFETSVYTNMSFGDTIKMYPTAERNITQPLYIRLKKTANVGNHNGTIQLTSTSAIPKTLTTSTSYVAPATLTITAKYFQKFYGSKITLGAGSKYFTSTGLMNNETIGSVTITPSGGTSVNAPIGYYDITPSAATGGTFSTSNYNINYVAGQFQVLYSLYNFTMTNSNANWVKGIVPLPKIINLLVSNVTRTSATFSGKIPNAFVNIESYGICYSTSINPTINDIVQVNNTNIPGTFTFNLTSLTPGTKYFVRAYVTVGNSTFYSQNSRFTTSSP